MHCPKGFVCAVVQSLRLCGLWATCYLQRSSAFIGLFFFFLIKSGFLASFENVEALAMLGSCSHLVRTDEHLSVLVQSCLLQSPGLPFCLLHAGPAGVWVRSSCKCTRTGRLRDTVLSFRIRTDFIISSFGRFAYSSTVYKVVLKFGCSAKPTICRFEIISQTYYIRILGMCVGWWSGQG